MPSARMQAPRTQEGVMSRPRIYDEPDIEDLLAEPIVRRLMARDGVNPDDVRALMRRVMRDAAQK